MPGLLATLCGSNEVSSDESFAELVRRVRSGDEQAAADLVRQFEPEIRREVRLRLRDPRLRRQFDSWDICQSVLASFFTRAASGQYELSRPDQLLRLLITMTRNKLVRQVRHGHAQKRDQRRTEACEQEDFEALSDGPSPSRLVSAAELLAELRNRLTPEERSLADRRSEGQDWLQIATEMGGSAEASRKQFSRAIDRVARDLGIDEAGDGYG
jgi:RNA polymerase sigma-70 factor (ECF subfamily)